MVIFSCNPCPHVIAYEDRMIALHNEFAPQGFPVVSINPNDPYQQPADDVERMRERAQEKGYPFPYLVDEGQHIYPAYGATRTPEVFLLENNGDGTFVVGTRVRWTIITKMPLPCRCAPAANAVRALLAGEEPNPATTVAIGCGIKPKE